MYSPLISTVKSDVIKGLFYEKSTTHKLLKEKCIMSVTMLNSLDLTSHVHMVVKVEPMET
jgi:hypothetical protein